MTPIRLAVFFIFVGTAYNFIIKAQLGEVSHGSYPRNTKSDHVVVLGYGVSGSQSVEELIERGTKPECRSLSSTRARSAWSTAEKLGVNVMGARMRRGTKR